MQIVENGRKRIIPGPYNMIKMQVCLSILFAVGKVFFFVFVFEFGKISKMVKNVRIEYFLKRNSEAALRAIS